MPQAQTEPISSFAAFRNRLSVSGTLVALTALRIGVGRDNSVIGNDLPVLRDVFGAPFVPGASIKGALRAQLEALLRGVIPDSAMPDSKQLEDLSLKISEIRKHIKDPEQCQVAIDEAISRVTSRRAAHDFEQLEQRTQAIGGFKRQNRELSDAQISRLIWNQSSLIDLTFGSPEVAGRLFVKDALVDRSLWFDQYEIRNGVALNRDTETAEDGLLYDYEVVPAGTRFGFELTLENAENWQLGMLLLALRPWQAGQVQIGGFRSRGLGYVQLIAPTFTFAELHEGQPDDILRMLCDPATLEQLGIAPAERDVEALKPGWYTAFRNELGKRLGKVSHA
jgi:CRISPR-associated RAMP protein (TIGR02581 family)